MNRAVIHKQRLVRVAVPVPVYALFDYIWHEDTPAAPGVRVMVPFGSRSLVGVVIDVTDHSEIPSTRLRTVIQTLDSSPLLSTDILRLLTWASRYYHFPVGEVVNSALPALLRKGKSALLKSRDYYEWVGPGELDGSLNRAALQKKIARLLMDLQGKKVAADMLYMLSPRWQQAVNALCSRGWAQRTQALEIPRSKAKQKPLTLNAEQLQCVERIMKAAGGFQPFLLDGITGSGKTEVYIQCISKAQDEGRQCLVLVPEIALTPQLMQRFEQRLQGCIVSLHSGLNDTQRCQNWLLATHGHADIVVGTRSAILVPLPRLGLIIVDEEHDSSLKQQEGFRYHARDIAIKRANEVQCPVILGSATPSFESLHNVISGRSIVLKLRERAGFAKPPVVALLDVRRRKLLEGLSDQLISAIRENLSRDGQTLIFINRRGFAPTLLCMDCGASAVCTRCDANMTVHARSHRLRCHFCGSERKLGSQCDSCRSENLDFQGFGTERIARALETVFPDNKIARIDRDSVRRKGELEKQLLLATTGEAQILVGTQMLAKGHHFPKLTLVGILDADRGLFGCDFRSLEHMAQLIIQVAGRAGREQEQGKVIIQTRNPDSPILQTLIHNGYEAFAHDAMSGRQETGLPPFSYLAILRAEAVGRDDPPRFLEQASRVLKESDTSDVIVMGPAPAPMERMAGRYRFQLLIQAGKRSLLHNRLSALCRVIGDLPAARSCRWSLDVDPVDIF